MKNCLLIAVVVAFAACAFAQDAVPVGAENVHFAKVYNPHTSAPPPGVTMTYYGGPIMYGTSNSIYIVYYGNWDTADQTIINTWAQSLGGTGLYNTMTTFYDNGNPNNFISSVINFRRSTNT